MYSRTAIGDGLSVHHLATVAPARRRLVHMPCGRAGRGIRIAYGIALAMIREAEAIVRKQRFLLCRYALIFVTGAVGLLETQDGSPLPVAALVGLALFSNLFLGTVPPFNFFDASMQAPILITDTAMVSAILLLSRASQEFYLFFFFVLIMAAKIENLKLLVIAAGAIGALSLLFTDLEAGWMSPLLMRIPFLFAAALFYGYVVLPERTGQMTPLTRAAAARLPRPPIKARVGA